MSRIWNKKKKEMVELKSDNMSCTEKSIARQYTDKSFERYNRGKKTKKLKENIQNIEKSVVEYQSKKDKYI